MEWGRLGIGLGLGAYPLSEPATPLCSGYQALVGRKHEEHLNPERAANVKQSQAEKKTRPTTIATLEVGKPPTLVGDQHSRRLRK
jgi:hypothetical protein